MKIIISENQYRRLFKEQEEAQIVPIHQDEMMDILKLCDNSFEKLKSYKICSSKGMRAKESTDWTIGVKAVKGGKNIGFYLFGNDTPIEMMQEVKEKHGVGFKIQDEELLNRISNKKGLEGVSVGLLPEYRGEGIGKQLLEYPRTMGIDYIWGGQSESISNLPKWLNRRKVLAFAEQGSQKFWITVEEF